MKRALRFTRSAIITIGAIVGLATIVVVVYCLVANVRPAIVISGSMEPTIPTGSMTFARTVDADTLRIGEIVTVPRNVGNGLVTHRIVDIQPRSGGADLTLRGDANDVNDPMVYSVSSAGKVVFHVPGLGTAASIVRTPLGITIIVILVVLYALFGIRRIPRESRRTEDDEDPRAINRGTDDAVREDAGTI